MTHLDRNKTTLGTSSFALSGKFWKALKRFKRRDRNLRSYISRSKSHIGHDDLEVKYGLGPGEALGV